MKYFTYIQIGGLEDPSYLLPQGFLQAASASIYYTAAEIPSIAPLAPWSASLISEGTFWTAYGDKWKAFIANGYTTNGMTLAIDDQSLDRWTQTLVLMREAGMNDTASFAIKDISGSMHQSNVAEVRTMLVGAGAYWYQGWATQQTTGSSSGSL
jgi:hypothetical protein